MLTREEFVSLYNAKDYATINDKYIAASPDEKRQLSDWLTELNTPEPPDENDPLAGLEGDVQPTEPNVETNNELETVIDKMVREQITQVNPREVAAKKRAQRSNMLRSIRSRYKLMEAFTVTECAVKIARDPQEVGAYLLGELKSGSGTFSYNTETKKFFLDNPFL